jgi:hypothetical protein
MGEVYRARDTKLGRDVAIKVLPAGVAQDAERLSRFKREAQMLASLNHPNIAAIYALEEAHSAYSIPSTGSGQAGSDPSTRSVQCVLFLVLELVEGKDLAERLKRGPIPVDEALAITRQIDKTWLHVTPVEDRAEARDDGVATRALGLEAGAAVAGPAVEGEQVLGAAVGTADAGNRRAQESAFLMTGGSDRRRPTVLRAARGPGQRVEKFSAAGRITCRPSLSALAAPQSRQAPGSLVSPWLRLGCR